MNIRISMDQGIAGLVATTGQTLNLPDAYENSHFNQVMHMFICSLYALHITRLVYGNWSVCLCTCVCNMNVSP